MEYGNLVFIRGQKHNEKPHQPPETQEDAMKGKIVVRKTPNCRHLYRATMKGFGNYGWGNTPEEARTKFYEMIEKHGEKQILGTYERPPGQST